ncbi:hypothetical protein XF_0130 [Xylella fastidiosa 9a5c]|uniref:Uncharacterized protein n=1 Tax=Xylella fastidiosa (strain 9a5c) TaxID=160492 RepID=Q9PH16_XYLFA|nr:hypothetical protein XF_0130 [Xylella fastidiosa 9a5c]
MASVYGDDTRRLMPADAKGQPIFTSAPDGDAKDAGGLFNQEVLPSDGHCRSGWAVQ